MSEWEIAQLNIAFPLAPLESAELSDFVANLDRINGLAEAAQGFVWRLKDESGNATYINGPFADDVIVNLSVWKSIDELHNYVYRTAHTEVMRRHAEWFIPQESATAVLWWVPAGHRPDAYEAQNRLRLLDESGPGPQAFTFKQRMAPPDT